MARFSGENLQNVGLTREFPHRAIGRQAARAQLGHSNATAIRIFDFWRRLVGPEQVAAAAAAVRHLFPFCVSACLGLAFRSAIRSASSALFEERNSNKKK